MEFLVKITVRLPPALPEGDRSSLLDREQCRGWELKREGMIDRIWRVPGRLANVGVWVAADATELHEALASLPVFPYAEIRVTPLARHYLEADRSVAAE